MTDSPTQVLFIGGAGRSGSTLLERMLATAPGTHSIGEARLLWPLTLPDNSRCGCGEVLAECPTWSAAFDAAFGGLGSIDLERMAREHRLLDTRWLPIVTLPWLGERHLDRLDHYRSRVVELYRVLARQSGAEWLLDSSKHPLYLDLLAGSHDLDVYVVHLVRRAEACVHSWSRAKADPRNAGASMPVHGTAYSTADWLAHNLGVARFGRRHPERYIRVGYEDLVVNPAGALHRIAEFSGVGVDTNRFTNSALVDLPVTHTAGGNPSRFAAGPQPLRLDERWRTDQSTVRRRLVGAATWPARRMLR